MSDDIILAMAAYSVILIISEGIFTLFITREIDKAKQEIKDEMLVHFDTFVEYWSRNKD